MTLNCKFCDAAIVSLIITPEMAFDDISKKFLEHLMRKHKREIQEIEITNKKCVAAYVAYLGMISTADVPIEEKWLIDRVTGLQDIVMASLGFDAEEIEESHKGSDTSDSMPLVTLDERLHRKKEHIPEKFHGDGESN